MCVCACECVFACMAWLVHGGCKCMFFTKKIGIQYSNVARPNLLGHRERYGARLSLGKRRAVRIEACLEPCCCARPIFQTTHPEEEALA